MGTDRGAAIAGRARLGWRAGAGALLFAIALVLIACGEDDVDTPATATPAEPTATAIATPIPAGDVKTSVESAVRACREKNVDLMAALVIDATREEIEAMFARGTDVQLVTFTFPEETGDTVLAPVRLSVQRETGAEDVERTWELERTPDGWFFTTLPDCF